MRIVGDIGGGAMGELSTEQAVAWVQAKDTRASTKILTGKFTSVIGSVMSKTSNTSAGGGNTRYTFDGTALHHESSGAGYHEGVSLFYVKRPGDIAKIVGIGYHVGAQTYDLTWKHHDWTRMRNVNRISLDR